MRLLQKTVATALGFFLALGLGMVGPLGKALSQTDKRDPRVNSVRTLNDKDFFFVPPTSTEDWKKRSEALREQLKVALGLYPMPVFAPMKPVARKIADRPEYTVHSVYLESVPGFLLTGSLYVPKGNRAVKEGKRPGVLCPHGHWQNGRFYENSEANAKKEIQSGAETTMEGATYPLQARCANLAMLGAVVFHYDMVGNADNGPVNHSQGFQDPRALLHLQGQAQLQTLNSIRALDYLMSLPEVDSSRIGVTGASGGGTQTFLLGALDSRPTVAFPAVMVGSRMQGGCVCENAAYLRVGTGNVEIAGLFYPRPLAMSGANDWTIAIEKEGLPELKKLYGLTGKADLVEAKCWPEFGHNYNQKSREFMYAWMNRHLQLGAPESIREMPFEPIKPKDLRVFDLDHPRPAFALKTDELRGSLEKQEEDWLKSLDVAGTGGRERWQKALLPFIRTAFNLDSLRKEEIRSEVLEGRDLPEGLKGKRIQVVSKAGGSRIPAWSIEPASETRGTVVWIFPQGKAGAFSGDGLNSEIKRLVLAGFRVVVPDYLGAGDMAPLKRKFEKGNPVYTYGYNSPLLVEDVRDICTVVRSVKGPAKPVILCGSSGPSGIPTALCGCLMGNELAGLVADLGHFNFSDQAKTGWPENSEPANFLPGALRFGGMPGLLNFSTPPKVCLFGVDGTGVEGWKVPGQTGDNYQLVGKIPEGDEQIAAKVIELLGPTRK